MRCAFDHVTREIVPHQRYLAQLWVSNGHGAEVAALGGDVQGVTSQRMNSRLKGLRPTRPAFAGPNTKVLELPGPAQAGLVAAAAACRRCFNRQHARRHPGRASCLA